MSLSAGCDELKREQAQIDAEAVLQRQRLALAQQSLARLESLRASTSSRLRRCRAKSEEVLACGPAQALERQRATLVRDSAALEGQRRELPLQAQRAQGEIERDRPRWRARRPRTTPSARSWCARRRTAR